MFYEGLHGGLVTDEVDVARHVDLLVGVVPIVNLEWIQKIHRDTEERGYDRRDVTDNILRRMYDYVHYITPQFSRTDVNFQRVPTVDTSNPFVARDIPTLDESYIVIRFRNPAKFSIDFPYLLGMLEGSFMSRRNSIVVPGGRMGFAIELIFTPIIEAMMKRRESMEPSGAPEDTPAQAERSTAGLAAEQPLLQTLVWRLSAQPDGQGRLLKVGAGNGVDLGAVDRHDHGIGGEIQRYHVTALHVAHAGVELLDLSS